MTPTPPKVLTLLAAYNGARWIAEQVNSILSQADVDVSIVVSDDGSTDDTVKQLREFAAGGRLRLTTPPLPTGAASQNFFSLIRQHDAAGFDFVAFSDQDDHWYADKLSRACRALTDGPAAGYSSAVTARWPDGRERILSQLDVPTQSDFLFEGAGQGCTFVLSAQFYRRLREFLLAHAELTQGLHYHDWTMYALARVWELSWVFDAHPSMSYRQHATNDTGARKSLSGVSRRLKLIHSGWYRRQLDLIANVCLAAAPGSGLLAAWRSLLDSPPGPLRRLQIARFCVRGGRRRRSDRLILISAALAGWI